MAHLPSLPVAARGGRLSYFGRVQTPHHAGCKQRAHLRLTSKVHSGRVVSAAAAQDVEAGKLISKTEIPAFIPREVKVFHLL